MATAIQSALVGQKKPKEALDEAQARIAADPEGLTRHRRDGHRRDATDARGSQERRFALALLVPALLVLLLTTTAPLVYLAWTSLQPLDLGMPWLSRLRRRSTTTPRWAATRASGIRCG